MYLPSWQLFPTLFKIIRPGWPWNWTTEKKFDHFCYMSFFYINCLVPIGKDYQLRNHTVFLSSRIFPPDWLKSFAKSWQHCQIHTRKNCVLLPRCLPHVLLQAMLIIAWLAHCYLYTVAKKSLTIAIRLPMDVWTIKTPNPISRLFLKIDLLTDFAALCFRDFIDWRNIHSVVCIFDPACELLPPWTKEQYLCTVVPLPSLWPPPLPPFPN